MRAPSAVAKLAGFAAVLALAFGGAALAGSRIDVHPGRAGARAGHAPGMGAMAAAVRGLAIGEGGLTLELAHGTAPRGRRSELAFRIADRHGRTVRHFDVEHAKRMHFILVRRDLTGFQHLHPVQAADGTWSVPATLRDAGAYRVFADFSVAGTPRTLAGDVAVDGTVRTRLLPAPTRTATVDGLRVTLTEGASRAGAESSLAFAVTRGGRPVAIQPYLGARGHLVALRQGDLAFLHVHPDHDSLRFMAGFPTAGAYRLFLQFQTGGRVHTAAFTQEVSR
jgi:hypothetical protein